MKRNELNKIFTAKVAEYLAAGYMVNTNTMAGSQGEIASVDFRKGDEIIRIVMLTDHEYSGPSRGDYIHIIVGRNTDRVRLDREYDETIWNSHLDVIEDLAYRKVSETWYISPEEAEGINEKRLARFRAQYIEDAKLTPSAAFIRALKKRKGFTNATRNNVGVARTERGYRVYLLARDGHISRKELIRFPNK